MTYPLAAAAVSFLLAMLLGPSVIAWLHARKMGKSIRELGPESHQVKAGTPTMGGLIILIPVAVSTVLLNFQGRSILVPLLVLLANGGLGAVDDLQTLVGSARAGISVKIKLLLLVIIATGTALVLHYGLLLESVYVPFAGKIPIGLWYVPIAVFIIVAPPTPST